MLPAILPFVPAIAQGVGSLVNYGLRRRELSRGYAALKRRQPYEQSPEGAYYNKLRTQGSIGPEAQSRIMGRVGAETGAAAAMGKAGYYANARRQMGTSGSVAFERGANKFDQERMRSIGRTAEDIAMENEQSKAAAERDYAAGLAGYQREGEERKAALDAARAGSNRELAGGLIGAAGSAASAYFDAKAAQPDLEYKRKAQDLALAKGRQEFNFAQSAENRNRALFDRAMIDNVGDQDFNNMMQQIRGIEDPQDRMEYYQNWLNELEYKKRSKMARIVE